MVFPRLVLTLLFLPFLAHAAASPKIQWKSAWHDLPELVDLLKTVPEGLEQLRKAEAKDPLFAEHIKMGSASFTETTFSRTYSLIDGHEQISLHHEVTLNGSLSVADAVVDLAHELVHFSEKGMINPYKAGFVRPHFVRNGIEGEGGELEALQVECNVAWALEKRHSNFPRHRLCEKYRGPANRFALERAREDYYAVGPWLAKLSPALKKELPELNDKPIVFTSSYAGQPYPVALVEEYAATRRSACENNQRKFRLIAAQASQLRGARKPAAVGGVDYQKLNVETRRLKSYDEMYCRDTAKR